jgi:lipopolysaccharide transport system permease protein
MMNVSGLKFWGPVWQHRDFIFGSIRREFQSKYASSMLGIFWSFLQPLATILVYTLIFSQIMKARLPGNDSAYAYSLYLCIGILTWGLFSEIVSRCQTIFLENANLLKKIQFPRICLPIITTLNALINFGIIFLLFNMFLILTGNFPGWVIVNIIPVLIIELLFSIGLGMIIGVLNVFFRDIGQFFTIWLQFWFWLTPIVYTSNILPPALLKPITIWNPMSPIIGAFQAIFVHAKPPDWASLTQPLLISVIFCFLGLHLFRKHAGELVDEL